MQIGAMNHPARNPLEEIDWFGRHGFDFVDFTLEGGRTYPVDSPALVAYAERRERYRQMKEEKASGAECRAKHSSR
jgi:hypothetical protein